MGGGLSVSLIYRHNVPSVALNGAYSVYLVLRNQGEQIFRCVVFFSSFFSSLSPIFLVRSYKSSSAFRIFAFMFIRFSIFFLCLDSLLYRFFHFRRLRITFPVDLKRTDIPEIPVFNPAQELWIPVEIMLAGYNGVCF